jgi:hypothetical protein
MLSQAFLCPVFIVLRDEVPKASAHQLSKEPWGIGDRRETSSLSRGHEYQPLALTAPDDAFPLSLFKKCKQACGIAQVLQHDVLECRFPCLRRF